MSEHEPIQDVPVAQVAPAEPESPKMKLNDPRVPEYVRKRGQETEKKWVAIWNALYEIEGEAGAWIGANGWLKEQIMTVVTLAATQQVRERLSFKIQDKQLIKRTDSGEEYITAVLADTDANLVGERHTPDVLKRWAEQINANPIIGDIDHEEYDKIISSAVTDDDVIRMFKTKKGIAKTVKAMYKNGRLYIRAMIDKRYGDVVRKAKGLSLEAVVTRDVETNTIVDGQILGFTFGVADSPVNPRAVVV